MLSRPTFRTRRNRFRNLVVHLLCISALLIGLLMLLAAPTQPAQAAPADPVSPQELLNPDGTLDLSTGFQGSLDLRGWNVILDQERGPALEPASSPDLPSAESPIWQALPEEGLDLYVYALAVMGSDLYVG